MHGGIYRCTGIYFFKSAFFDFFLHFFIIITLLLHFINILIFLLYAYNICHSVSVTSS